MFFVPLDGVLFMLINTFLMGLSCRERCVRLRNTNPSYANISTCIAFLHFYSKVDLFISVRSHRDVPDVGHSSFVVASSCTFTLQQWKNLKL